MARRISILGATGSIGASTVDLVERAAPGEIEVVAITGNSNVAGLAALARRLGAEVAVTADEDRLGELRDALSGTRIEAAAGDAALVEAATRPAEWVMSAIVGAAGLAPTLAAARNATTVCGVLGR